MRALLLVGMLVGVRIAAMSEMVPSAHYRVFSPLWAMKERGHDTVWPDMKTGRVDRRGVLSSEVILVGRCHDPASRKLLREARDHGVGIVWDVDDDIRNCPDRNQARRDARVRKQLYHSTVNAARLADVVITSTDVLRALYESAGIERIEVVENYLLPGTMRKRNAIKHEGVVIGWIAAREHGGDARTLAIADTLGRIQREHPDVHVECIGVDLALANRYTHTLVVPFYELPARMAGWDIALAPIADTAFNASRSNIKVKEYAASGVPWLASSRGSYANLGEQHGGRLVADDGWYEAIDELVRDPLARQQLAGAGRSWARGQTMRAAAARYEELLVKAASRSARARSVA